jgi:hypothetical protein
MRIKPLLQLRFCPGLIQPVSRVLRSLSKLFGSGFVGLTRLLEKGITVTRLGDYQSLLVSATRTRLNKEDGQTRDIILVGESLQLAFGPSIENPILDIIPGLIGILFSFVPVVLDLLDKAVLGRFDVSLGLFALVLQVLAKLDGVPAVVRSYNIVVPILSHQILEILAIGGGWVGNVVV